MGFGVLLVVLVFVVGYGFVLIGGCVYGGLVNSVDFSFLFCLLAYVACLWVFLVTGCLFRVFGDCCLWCLFRLFDCYLGGCLWCWLLVGYCSCFLGLCCLALVLV